MGVLPRDQQTMWYVFKVTLRSQDMMTNRAPVASDIVYLTALGSKLLVLSSFEAARDLLDRKGAIYSSRPRLVVKNEL